jgi:dipeptidyl aminopeptidase/acylaminoacyl peptidase
MAKMTAETLWQLRRVGLPAVAPQGGFMVVGITRYDLAANEGTERLYRVSAPGAEPRPLTTADVSSSQPAISPDGASLAFVRKPQGKEKAQLHVMPLDGGEARCLTDLPLGACDPRWFPDGKRLCVVAPLLREALTVEGTRRLVEERAKSPVKAHVTEDRLFRFWDEWLTDGAVPHLFVVDVATGEARDLLPESERFFDFMDDGQYDIAPDGEELVFAANVSRPPHARTRWAIFTVPSAGGAVRCLTSDNPADDVRPRYSPCGRSIVYGAKRDWENYADRVRLCRIDRKSLTQTVLTEAWDRSPSAWEFADGHTLVIEADERGRSVLYRMSGDKTPELLCRDGGLHGARPARDGYVYAQHQTYRTPPEVVRISVLGGKPERMTRVNDELLAHVELGEMKEKEFPGGGGDLVHMFVLYPPGADGSRPRPLVHMIHGGPFGAHGDLWHFRWNPHVLAAAGYVVAMVNFHGSSGYGDEFARSVLGDWGGKAATDILLGTDVLVAAGDVDPARMALTGGSFGGYMTLWLASQTDRFACAVAHAAVFDVPTLFAGDVTQGLDREIGGEPWRGGRAAIDRHNPAAHANGFKTPLLILHGEKDYRVPVSHALEAYGILKAKGVEARLVYYPDENHWILKPQNSLHWYGEFLGWLERYFKN